jgi:GH24 family phage-related lysozyme (muramidase)
LTIEQLIERLKEEEGFSPESFWDNEQWTWGYGTKAPGGPGWEIDAETAEGDLEKRIWVAIEDYQRLFDCDPPGLTEARMEGIISMLFNLGATKFSMFRNTIRCMKEGNWTRAALHASSSLWYRQVGRRSRRIVKEFETGEHHPL